MHISIFLTFSLLVSNLGFSFNVHCCDDKMASVSINTLLNSQETEKGCCSKIEKETKCCKNKIIKANIKSDQIVGNSLSLDTNFIAVITSWKPIIFASNFHYITRGNAAYFCDANAPPLYLLYSQYTFYS